MSSPPVNIPHKADSGGGRRSALTSAFEELALFADQKTDEGEEFSARLCVDQTQTPCVEVGGDFSTEPELRGPSFRSATSRARDPTGAGESASIGRQHGSFSAISFLQQSASDGDLDGAPAGGRLVAEGEGSLSHAPFEFNGGCSEFTSAEPNEMSFPWNSLDGDGDLGTPPGDPSALGGAFKSVKTKTSPERHGSGSLGATTATQIIPPRVVVVHVGNDDDEGCAASAGRKQRGSFSSLLLLEAHELSTLDCSPTTKRAMQSHIEDGGFQEGSGGDRAHLASMRVLA